MNVKNLILSFLLLSVIGCKVKDDFPKPIPVQQVEKQGSKVRVDDKVREIADAMEDVSKDDALLMYKQFAGLVAYLENTEKIDTVKELNKIFDRFQSDYGYNRGRYKKYSKAVSEFFVDRGYQDYENIVSGKTKGTDVSRKQVIEDIQVLADAAKVAWEEK